MALLVCTRVNLNHTYNEQYLHQAIYSTTNRSAKNILTFSKSGLWTGQSPVCPTCHYFAFENCFFEIQSDSSESLLVLAEPPNSLTPDFLTLVSLSPTTSDSDFCLTSFFFGGDFGCLAFSFVASRLRSPHALYDRNTNPPSVGIEPIPPTAISKLLNAIALAKPMYLKTCAPKA